MIAPAMTAVKRLRRDCRGAYTVEFAMVALLLFFVTFATIDVGLILWSQGTLQAIAADAARCGAISGSSCTGSNTISSFVQSEANTWIMSPMVSSLTVNVNSAVNTTACPPITVGTYETVEITTSYLTHMLPPPFSNYSIDVCASYAM